MEDGRAVFQAQEGGVYVAVKDDNTAVVIGAVVGSLVLIIIIIVGTILYCRRKPDTWRNIKRQFTSKV